MAPDARKRLGSSAVHPCSASTAPVCSPARGAGRGTPNRKPIATGALDNAGPPGTDRAVRQFVNYRFRAMNPPIKVCPLAAAESENAPPISAGPVPPAPLATGPKKRPLTPPVNPPAAVTAPVR